jgi:excisionase family DNA binding protein
MPEQLLTVDEVSHRLHITTATVRRYAQLGRLRAIKLGGNGFPDSKLWRFDPDEIERTLHEWQREQSA